MRKYQQLLLLIISVVCVITLLFYRNEYMKLRSVLTVLNFFGSVSSSNVSCYVFSSNQKKSLSHRYKYAEPRSVWSKFDNIFIYSSFWETNGEGGTIRSIAVGPKSSFFDYTCRVWFEVGDIIVSEQGHFSFLVDLRSKRKTIGNDNFKYILKCSVSTKPNHGVPYGVLWIISTNSTKLFSPISTLRVPGTQPVICVLPDFSGVPKTQIVEFVSYYSSIGVKDIIIYDSGVQHSIYPFLETLSGSEELLNSIIVLPWNFPLSNLWLNRVSLSDDCLSRTFGAAKLVGILGWNEFVMPSKNDLNSLLLPNMIAELIDLSFETWSCCSDTVDEENLRSLPTFLRKTMCKKEINEAKMFINLKSYGIIKNKKTYSITPDVAVVRRYDPCTQMTHQAYKKLPIADSFYSIKNHKILRLWKSHLNASSIFK